MHWWWGQGTQVPWIGMILGPIMMIGTLVLTIVIAMYIARAFGFGSYAPPPTKTARDILDERFARGEIDREEYLDRKKHISGG